MASQNSDPATNDDGTDDEAGRIASLDERFAAIETKQAEQDGMLSKILEKVGGGSAPDPKTSPQQGSAGGSSQSPGAPDLASIQDTVRRELAETRAREQEEARRKGEADRLNAAEQAIEALRGEQAPREPEGGVRGRLQRAMFGRQP